LEVFTLQAVEQLGAQDLRRSGRIPKEIAILLTGCDAEGKQFIEKTKTVVLSRHGAGIVSAHKLAIEQELVLVRAESNKETEIRVVGQIGSADGSYTYGVAFLNPHVNFWGVEFPPAKGTAASRESMEFQCTVCGCREAIGSGALELDIHAIHGGILRDCKRCQTSTLWTQSVADGTDSAPPPEAKPTTSEPPPAPEASPSPVPFKNRRKHQRVRVNFTACVRNPGSEDRLVLCENVSRGGLCFKSSQRYYETSRIEVAAPYSPGSPCILVPAQIVHVQELPEEGMFRCGVQFLDLARDPLAA
jgi:PilZ domain